MDTPEKATEAPKPPMIGVSIRTDVITDTILQDPEKKMQLLLIAVPLSLPKFTILGFLWSVLDNMTRFCLSVEMAAAEEKQRSGGIIRPTMKSALVLGKKLLKP